MKISRLHDQSLGLLLSTYASDLNYIHRFQESEQSGFAESEVYAIKTTA
jgi:hypothetical protein